MSVVEVRSPAMTYAELSRVEPDRTNSAAGTSVAQSRRAKNAAHRADDVEFAFEIGSGLLTEVRRLQSLLGERDKAIQDMKEKMDDLLLKKSVEDLRTALKKQEQNSDKFKEENGNLEIRQQELTNRNEYLTANIQHPVESQADHKRLTKNLAQSRDAVDQHKNKAERPNNVIEELKAKDDTDIAQARKHAADVARIKSDLQETLETMRPDVACAARRLPRYGSPLTRGGPETKDFLTPAGHGDPENVFGTTGRGSTNRRNLNVLSMVLPISPASIVYASSKNTPQASGSSHNADDGPAFDDRGRLIAPASPLSQSDESRNTWLPVSIRNLTGRSFLRRPSPSPASPEFALPKTPTRLRPQRPAVPGSSPSVPTASRGLLSPVSTGPRRQISPLLSGRGSSNTKQKQGEVQASTSLDAQVQVQSWFGDDPAPPAAVSASKRRKNG